MSSGTDSYSWVSFVILGVGYCALGFILDYKSNWDSIVWIGLTAPVLSYLVLFVGLSNVRNVSIFKRGDYSYGIYLYAFPIQQAVIQLSGNRNPLIVFLLTIVPVIIFAIMSWHIVEKPMLKFRKRFSLHTKLSELSRSN